MSFRPDVNTTADRAGALPGSVKAEMERATWLDLAAIMAVLVGVMNIIDGLSAARNSSYISHHVMFSSVGTWGWVLLGFGIVQVCAGFAVYKGAVWGAAVVLVTAFVNALAQMASVREYPVWSLLILSLDVFVIYGLVVKAGIGARRR
jgi:hypothetical protein